MIEMKADFPLKGRVIMALLFILGKLQIISSNRWRIVIIKAEDS